ncbi:MAG: translation initiation factor 2 [Pseudomonadota bacterium]
MKFFVVAALAGVAVSGAVSGCATITRGGDDAVRFVADGVPEARMVTSHGFSCVTPCTLEVPRDRSFEAVFTAPDGSVRRVSAVSDYSKEGVGAHAGNLLLGGIGGLVVDGVTGANKDIFPNPVVAEFDAPELRAPDVNAAMRAPSRIDPDPVGPGPQAGS